MAAGFGTVSFEEAPAYLTRRVAGFWRRLIAFVIDCSFLCVPCFLVGGVLSDYFHYHQRVAILVGLLIVIPYFALFGSDLANGQTLGMKLTSIQVVDREGRKLPFAQSLLRYLILLPPLIGVSNLLPFGTPSWISEGIGWGLTAIVIMITYLAIFNSATRQSLHDFCTDAFVAEKSPEGPIVTRPFWTGHWMVMCGMLAGALIVGLLIDHFVSPNSIYGQLKHALNAVSRMPNVGQASVYIQKNWDNGRTSSGFRVVVKYQERPSDLERSAAEIADVLLRSESDASSGDYISIVSDESFRVGFATLTSTNAITHSPGEWKQLIANTPTQRLPPNQ